LENRYQEKCFCDKARPAECKIRGWGGSDETSNSQYYPIKMMDENNVAKPISDILRWDVEEIVFLEGDIKRVYLIPSKQSTGEDN